jgi:hypothetical protein
MTEIETFTNRDLSYKNWQTAYSPEFQRPINAVTCFMDFVESGFLAGAEALWFFTREEKHPFLDINTSSSCNGPVLIYQAFRKT